MSTENLSIELQQTELQRVTRINGIALPLGSMSMTELEAINGHVVSRLESAQADYQTIGAYLDKRFEIAE